MLCMGLFCDIISNLRCFTLPGSQNGSESSDRRSEDKSLGSKDKPNPSKGDGGGDTIKKQKLTFGIKPTANLVQPEKGIQIKIGAQKPSQPGGAVKPPSRAVAAAFNDDEDDEPEEMPPEARTRMRNIGRETPTSAGPNSFGKKTKQGFCDAKKMFEKTMKKAMDSSAVAAPAEAATDSD